MKIIFILGLILSIMTISSCSIIKKNKEITKEKIEISEFSQSELQIKEGETISYNGEIISSNQLLSLLSSLDFQYDGEVDDSAKIAVNYTASGVELMISGSAKAKLKSESLNKNEDSRESIKSETHKTKEIDYHEEKNSALKIKNESVEKNKNVKRTDFSAWMWIVVLVVILFSLGMYWIFGKPNKVGN